MMHCNKARIRLMVLGAAAVLALTGCSAGTPTTSATVTSAITVAASPEPPSTTTQGDASASDGRAEAPPSPDPSPNDPEPVPTTAASPVSQARISTQPKNGATGVSPIAPVVVTAQNGTLAAVAMTNPEGREVPGQLSPDKTKWTSTEPLGYNRSYTITATAKDNIGANASTSTFTTLKPKQTIFPSFFPNPTMKKVGVGQPMVVIFDKPPPDRAAAEKTLTVKTVPAVEGAWYWWDNRTLHYRPKTYWKPGTKITVTAKVYGVYFGEIGRAHV